MSGVFSNMITTSTEDLIDGGALEGIDVLLSGGDEAFHELQAEIERDVSYVVLSLDAEDLQDKEFLVREIYRLICNEDAGEQNSIVENIEIIEEELAGTQSCILCLEDFFGCSEDAQAILLELVIVSHFKLLLGIKSVPEPLFNEKLWKVLVNRASWVDFSLAAPVSTSADELEDDEYFEENHMDESDEDEEEILSAHARPELKTGQQKQWYQMIPKYHLGAALILLLLVFALWNMDLTKTKQKSIDLNAETPASLDVRKPEATASMNQEVEQEQTSKSIDLPIDAEPKPEASIEQEVTPTETVAVNQQPKTSPPVDIVEEVTEEVVEPVVQKPVEKPVVKVVPVVKKTVLVDWSPYQSSAFIQGINSKYYTLQLLASHNEQGIRDFLKEKGSSSEYAVYTTEKDGKPWHVIIYGVYESNESASLARQDLPSYLKSYSPWVRSIADVQKSLQ